MSLPEFLLRRNEGHSTWLFIRRWVPTRTERYSWLRVVAVTVACAGLWALVTTGLLCAVFGAFGGAGEIAGLKYLLPWVAATAAEIGGCIGFCWSLLSRLCWNQRTARIAATPDSPEATAPWPKGGILGRAISGLAYVIVICLVTPLLLFHAIENTRGAWAWRQKRAELKAKGECFEIPCIIPTPARDEDNFFATPFWRRFDYVQMKDAQGRFTNKWLQGSFPNNTNFVLPNPPETVSRTQGANKKDPTDGRTDLAAWATQFRFVTTNTGKLKYDAPHLTFPLTAIPGKPADDVLVALSKFDATLAELTAAAPRPRSVYPTHYEEGFNALLPNLAVLKSTAQICQLRAVARLAAGDSTGAASDTLLAFRMGEASSEDPLLICQLVRFACDVIATRALWEGLVDHRWNDAQLTTFQTLLAKRDYPAGIIRAFEGERAMGNDATERLLQNRMRGFTALDQLGSGEAGYSDTPLNLAFLMPSGWIRQNQVCLLTGYQLLVDHARTTMNPANRARTLKANQQAAVSGEELAKRYGVRTNWPKGSLRTEQISDDYLMKISANPSPFNILTKMLLPAITRSTAKADRAQTTAGMAVVACALERHRLAHGTLPATLAELVPAYLPAVPEDWMSGEPLHYERTADGVFRLWSVGPDGQDDGGIYKRSLGKDGHAQSEDLDWPWPQPVMSKEPRLF